MLHCVLRHLTGLCQWMVVFRAFSTPDMLTFRWVYQHGPVTSHEMSYLGKHRSKECRGYYRMWWCVCVLNIVITCFELGIPENQGQENLKADQCP